MHDRISKDASVATNLDSGSRLPITASHSVSSLASHSSLPALHRGVPPPSPPCSPPRSSDVKPSIAGTVRTPQRGTLAPMLQASSTFTTAKLDISLLLKSSPSPPPSSPGVDVAHGPLSRASSVPAPSTQHFDSATSQHRPSVSSSATGASAPRLPTSAIRSNLQRDYRDVQAPDESRQTHRPVLPPLVTSQVPHSPQAATAYSQSYLSATSPQHHTSSPLNPSTKRPPPSAPHPAASPAKRQSKWTPEEDALIIELRGGGMKWEEISKRLPGRSAISCRLHYQNYLERRSEWDEERKNRLARLYERLKSDMWGPLAAELGIPWRAAEAMHWQLGEADMARRAGVVPFSLATSASGAAQALGSQSVAAIPGSLSGGRYVHGMQDRFAPQGVGHHAVGLQQPNTRDHRLGRVGTLGERLQEGSLAGLEPGSTRDITSGNRLPQSQVFLPSLAELDRGLTAIDEPNRSETSTSTAGVGGYSSRLYDQSRYPR